MAATLAATIAGCGATSHVEGSEPSRAKPGVTPRDAREHAPEAAWRDPSPDPLRDSIPNDTRLSGIEFQRTRVGALAVYVEFVGGTPVANVSAALAPLDRAARRVASVMADLLGADAAANVTAAAVPVVLVRVRSVTFANEVERLQGGLATVLWHLPRIHVRYDEQLGALLALVAETWTGAPCAVDGGEANALVDLLRRSSPLADGPPADPACPWWLRAGLLELCRGAVSVPAAFDDSGPWGRWSPWWRLTIYRWAHRLDGVFPRDPSLPWLPELGPPHPVPVTISLAQLCAFTTAARGVRPPVAIFPRSGAAAGFTDLDCRELLGQQAAAFLCFCRAVRGGEYWQGIRRFMERADIESRAGAGKPTRGAPAAERLAAALGRDLAEIDREFGDWLGQQP